MATFMKQALVIGNEAYLENPLQKCVNDAIDMSICLYSIGFQVKPAVNLRAHSMQAITHRFVQSIQPGSIVMFYFSGHGIQYNGINYLIPTDDGSLYLDELDSSALNVQQMINNMYQRSPRLMLIILDVCRRDGSSTTQDGRHLYSRGTILIQDGLAPMQAPPATIIAYSCAADESSSTLSMNGRNSLYTFHLLRHIRTPNTDIDLVLRNVAADVQRDPLNFLHQIPFRYSSCNEIICLVNYSEMNAPMLPIAWQPGPVFRKSFFSNNIYILILEVHLEPYRSEYVKAPAFNHFYPYINTSQYLFTMPYNDRPVKQKSLTHAIRNPMAYDYPYLWRFYPRW
jgi:hypothetical protein